MNNLTKGLGLVLAGVALGAVLTSFSYQNTSGPNNNESMGGSDRDEKKPLYWVAPMDPNYKREKPGKSPMGMDLIPVYEDNAAGDGEGPGTIRISPDVVNNLGVRTARVERAPLHSAIKTVGYVQYDEDRLVHIHARIEGWIETLYVKASGDPVTRGQALYTIYSPTLVNAQEELVLALKRKNPLLIDAAEQRLLALQLPQRAIRELKRSRKVKQSVTFYAPTDGVVDNLNIRSGFFVKPDKTLMVIGSLDEVWVEAEVFERQAPLVQAGAPVTMSLNYVPGKTWQGFVDYIYPTLDSKTRTIKVRLRFDNSEGELKPNMFAQVTIHAESKEEPLLVPREALIRTGNSDRAVLAMGEGRFKSVNVKVGRLNDQHAEILQGLDEGERVVTSAQFLIDSESSKTSDFMRMNHRQETADDAWVEARVIEVMGKDGKLVVAHQAIEQWQWPEMEMDFTVAETVDMSELLEGMNVHIQIRRAGDGDYEIVKIDNSEHGTSRAVADEQSAVADGVINTIMAEHRMLNISRGPIQKWNRPAATMDFNIAEGVDIAALQTGMKVQFTFVINDGQLVVTDIQLPQKGELTEHVHSQE